MRTRIGLVALTGLGLVASACGSSDSASGGAASTGAATSAAATTAAAASATTAGAATTKAAAATTAAAASGVKYGKQADGTYLGKGDFKIDPKKCPADWNVKQGITDKEIKVFQSLPTSGPLAGFGLIADGMRSYFRYVNEQGGIGGRQIVHESKDDVYQADRTKANIDEAITGKQYALFSGVLGTPNNLAIWDTTNKECMPSIMTATGAAQWGDAENHPWTSGLGLDYTSEAILWSEWLKKEFPNGAKVGAITFNNDFGKSYDKGFKAAIKGSKIELVVDELHEANAPNLTNQFTNIEAKSPDVILIQTSGAFCTQAMAEIEKRGFKGRSILSATCGSISQYFKPLVDQGLTGKDTYMVQSGKDANDPEWASDDFIKLFHDTLKKQGLDDKQSTYFTGWAYAWGTVEVLKLAATLEGGLDRANIMIAARSLDTTSPFALPGMTTKMEGLKDAYMTEGGRMAQYKVTDPKQLGGFVKVTDVINKEGGLGTYSKFQSIAGG